MPLPPSLDGATRRVRVTVGSPRLEPAQVRRLAELGIRAGAEVTVLHKTVGGGRVVAVGDARIALDRQTVAAIPVLGPG